MAAISSCFFNMFQWDYIIYNNQITACFMFQICFFKKSNHQSEEKNQDPPFKRRVGENLTWSGTSRGKQNFNWPNLNYCRCYKENIDCLVIWSIISLLKTCHNRQTFQSQIFHELFASGFSERSSPCLIEVRGAVANPATHPLNPGTNIARPFCGDNLLVGTNNMCVSSLYKKKKTICKKYVLKRSKNLVAILLFAPVFY